MRVVINGLPFFGNDLAKKLQKKFPADSFTFYNTYYSRWDQLKFLFTVPFADLIISMNGITTKSGSMNWCMFWNKKIVMQWQGTDVLHAIERHQKNTLYTQYVKKSIHFADSDWLEEELRSIQINPIRLTFKCITPLPILEKYPSIKALTYLAEGRKEFYGFNHVVQLANEFPQISFTVCGMNKPNESTPSNIKFMGWVPRDSFVQMLSEHAIFLRLTEHDGYSVSVIEALSSGAEVLMTLPDKNTRHCTTPKEIKEQFNNALKALAERNLVPRFETAKRINEFYNEEKILQSYYNTLKKIVNT
ncbi:MAG: hypothetical protein ACKO8Q_00345 [Bacteroidota bacterium]|jgi:hypothetical protein